MQSNEKVQKDVIKFDVRSSIDVQQAYNETIRDQNELYKKIFHSVCGNWVFISGFNSSKSL